MALAKPAVKTYGQSASVQNEVMRLERANASHKQKLEDMQKELAGKIHLKKEIEDWFAEKIAIEFQIEREQYRVITMQGELANNQKVFDHETDTLRQLLQKKQKQLEALAIADKKTQRIPDIVTSPGVDGKNKLLSI